MPLILQLALTLAVVLVALAPGPASAERWRVQPRVNLETGYDDNIRLSVDDAKSSFLATLDARLNASRSTENSNLGVYARIGGTSFLDEPDLDNTRGEAVLDFGYRLERHRFGLGAGVDSRSTLYSEVATTGLVQVNRQRNSWNLNGDWSYRLGERSSINLDADYLDVSYDVPQDRIEREFTDYHLATIDLSGTFGVTERLGLVGRVNYGRYEAQETLTNEYDNVGVFVGGNYALSERSSLRAQLGLRRTEQTRELPGGGDFTESSSGPVYFLRYFRRFEAGGGLDIEARRELAPSGSAQVLDTTGLDIKIRVPVTGRWGFGVAAEAFRNRRPDGRGSLQDRKYASIEPGVNYRIDETLTLSASYRFRWQDREQLPDDAMSNAVFLTLNWTRPWDL